MTLVVTMPDAATIAARLRNLNGELPALERLYLKIGQQVAGERLNPLGAALAAQAALDQFLAESQYADVVRVMVELEMPSLLCSLTDDEEFGRQAGQMWLDSNGFSRQRSERRPR
jgi:hypothetical protein